MITHQKLDELGWFDDSPDAGDPACICSYCGRVIDEDQVPLRIWSQAGKKEARLCEGCTALFLASGLIKEVE